MIVGWENKQEIPSDRLALINKATKRNQPKEENVYMQISAEKPCVNLISVKHLTSLPNPVSVVNLVKRDGHPLKPRTRAGNWTYVNVLPEWIGVSETVIEEQLSQEHETAIKKSAKDDVAARKKRLAAASPLPTKVQVISHAYRRNSDVVAEVRKRAKGKCELCKKDAPFLRKSDGSPFLEIHHIVTLADGGADTVANAKALCPNCHRQMHFGISEEE